VSEPTLKEFLAQALAGCESTLRATSYDKHNREYLCDDETTTPVYDFDRYIEREYSSGLTPASPDAILLRDDKVYFVEFKNQPQRNIRTSPMQNKFARGTEVLKELVASFELQKAVFHFCVVYKNSPQARYFNPQHIESNVVRFGLEELNKDHGSFYDHVITDEVDFYIEHFAELNCG